MARPNILVLMTDQMQGRVLDPRHPCQTPNLDKLAAGGVRFSRAYTPNAVCSPARASLMTGLLPHNHGVLQVTHTGDTDQNVLRDKPHFAQRLVEAGYRTGYFGKWHVEHSEQPKRFGWQQDESDFGGGGKHKHGKLLLEKKVDQPEGYTPTTFYGVTDLPPEQRGMGLSTACAERFLDDAFKSSQPWCCFVSLTEPHDPFICGKEAYARYNPAELPLPPNFSDNLAGRAALYRKSARAYANFSERDRREAMACYFALITEIDAQFGRVLKKLDAAGKREDTIVVLCADHGELLGAHGLYCKNISAFEEVYNIPLVLSGPGIAAGVNSSARVGLHDVGPTLLELCGAAPLNTTDSRSFAPVLKDPRGRERDYTRGYSEYFGNRFAMTQRVVWDDHWKFVLNGFDFDELYNLEQDPFELNNLAEDPTHAAQLRKMVKLLWQNVRDSGDHSLWKSHYAALHLAPYGPNIANE